MGGIYRESEGVPRKKFRSRVIQGRMRSRVLSRVSVIYAEYHSLVYSSIIISSGGSSNWDSDGECFPGVLAERYDISLCIPDVSLTIVCGMACNPWEMRIYSGCELGSKHLGWLVMRLSF